MSAENVEDVVVHESAVVGPSFRLSALKAKLHPIDVVAVLAPLNI